MFSKFFTSFKVSPLIVSAAIVGAALAMALPAASANVITFTGGDPGEGITLNNPLYAVDPKGVTTILQGVTFATSNANVSMPSMGAVTADYVDSGDETATPNDNALYSILTQHDSAYSLLSTPTAVITISGLVAGDSYVINTLVGGTPSSWSTISQSFSYNGASTPSDTLTSTTGSGYDVQDTVVAQPGGDITETIAPISGSQHVIFSALAVTAVPEPATLGLLAVGGLGLLLIKRRRTA